MTYVERLPVRPGLGRHVRHDPRSAAYALPVLPKTALASQHWPRRIAVLDQGNLGSCTGNAAAGWLGTDNATRQGLPKVGQAPIDEAYAVSLYAEGTALDDYPGTWPPDDTGCDGLTLAKVLQKHDLAGSYSHAFTFAAVPSSLQTSPGMWGTVWLNSMFDTDASGHVSVVQSSGVAGGHEVIVDQVDITTTGTVERVWFTNSWNTSWGVQGRAWVSPSEMTWLLSQQGDYTVPATAPAPAPSPGPAPTPPLPPDNDADVVLWSRTRDWASARHTASNRLAATAVKQWAKLKGFQ